MVVGAFNQEKALVGAFSVNVQPVVEPMEHYTALFLVHQARRGEVPRPLVLAVGLPVQRLPRLEPRHRPARQLGLGRRGRRVQLPLGEGLDLCVQSAPGLQPPPDLVLQKRSIRRFVWLA